MWYIILGVIIVSLIIKLILINAEVRNITKQLRELTSNKTQKKLTTTIAHKNIQNMCVEINRNLMKQQEQQIATRNHEEQLKQSIANLSHDLRTPLTSIMGYITMMKTDESKTEEYLEIIEGRAKNLNTLVNEFYELSIIEDNDYTMELDKIDMVAVLTNVLMGNFSLFEQNGITPQINIPDKAVGVIGNIGAYERILQNIISNAIKYNEGFIDISLIEENENCIITISNQASSLSDEDTTHLFDRFYTADSSRTKKNTGLGLYIVKTLCEKLDAQVSCELSVQKLLAIRICTKINR